MAFFFTEPNFITGFQVLHKNIQTPPKAKAALHLWEEVPVPLHRKLLLAEKNKRQKEEYWLHLRFIAGGISLGLWVECVFFSLPWVPLLSNRWLRSVKAGLQDLFIFHFVPFQEGDSNEVSFLFTAYSQNPVLLLWSSLHLTRVKNQPDFKAEIKDCSETIYLKKKKKS